MAIYAHIWAHTCISIQKLLRGDSGLWLGSLGGCTSWEWLNPPKSIKIDANRPKSLRISQERPKTTKITPNRSKSIQVDRNRSKLVPAPPRSFSLKILRKNRVFLKFSIFP